MILTFQWQSQADLSTSTDSLVYRTAGAMQRHVVSKYQKGKKKGHYQTPHHHLVFYFIKYFNMRLRNITERNLKKKN